MSDDCVVTATPDGWQVSFGGVDYGQFAKLDEAFKAAMQAISKTDSRVLVAVKMPDRELVLLD